MTVAFGAWLMVGLLVDGYVHNTRGDQLESFLTPWHGLLYSGFLASALWITWPMFRASGSHRERLAALPDGYAAGAMGAVIFGIGGFADSVWHSILGIELDLEALVSPPHLVLFAGAMLILITPARAAWRRPGATDHTLRAFMPALMSVTLATLLVAFFFMYASGLYDFHATTMFATFFEPGGRFADDPFLQEVLNGSGVVARVLTTAFLMIPALLMLRRWSPPRGTFTVLFTTYTAFMLVLENFAIPAMVAAGCLTGVVADVLVARLDPRPDRPTAIRLFAAAVPATLWLLHFGVLAVVGVLGWPFVFWGGTVLFGAGTGYALSLLIAPPSLPSEVVPSTEGLDDTRGT